MTSTLTGQLLSIRRRHSNAIIRWRKLAKIAYLKTPSICNTNLKWIKSLCLEKYSPFFHKKCGLQKIQKIERVKMSELNQSIFLFKIHQTTSNPIQRLRENNIGNRTSMLSNFSRRFNFKIIITYISNSSFSDLFIEQLT